MSKYLLLPLLLLAGHAAADESTARLLRQADAFRLPNGAARVETEVSLYRNEVLDKERQYTVYLKPGRRSLVLMKSPAEAGQKILMLGEQFWLLMPDTQRPLRITASQKLLGEAATGDVASMTWSEDYAGEVMAEVACPLPPPTVHDVLPEAVLSTKPRPCLQLKLQAAQAGVTYSQIELFLEKSSKLPVKADLYVGSGKRAKEAWYLPKSGDAPPRIMSMLLLDDIQPHRRTVIRYRSIIAKEAPDEFFNPAALVRNSLAGW